jgi:hypothetical protein
MAGMNETPNQTPDHQGARRRGPIALFADFFLALQAKILWPCADGLRAVARALRRGPGNVAYGFKRIFVWPLTDRFSLLSGPIRVIAVTGVALVVAVGVAAVFASSTKDSVAIDRSPIAEVSAAQAEAPASAPVEEPEPTLQGATPVFTPPSKKAAPKHKAADEPTANSNSTGDDASGSGGAPAATEKISSYPSASRPTAAEASTIPGPTAGAAAIAVAREFSGAFVVYETEGKSAEVRRAFAATTTPELTKALLKRPPRQPSKVKVPRARVLNVVPGPSKGSVFTVSVSLLRVGVTSELRLEMEKLKKQGWRVTNVLG